MPGWVMGTCVRAPAVSNKLHISYVNSARYIEGYMGKVRKLDLNHRSSPRKSVSHRAQLLAVARWKGLTAETFRKVSVDRFSVSPQSAVSFIVESYILLQINP